VCETVYLADVSAGQCDEEELAEVCAGHEGLLRRAHSQAGDNLLLGLAWVSAVGVLWNL